MGYWSQFLYSQLVVKLPEPSHDLSGKTIIVTGSNTGLGLEAARHFTRLNAHKVVLAVRSLEKGERAKLSIEESTSRRNVVEVWPLDLQSYDSVKQFSSRAIRELDRLDVLVQNAAIVPERFNTAEDNEATITTNVISTFLLGLLLLPKLQETVAKYDVVATISIISSELHALATFPERKSDDIFASLNDEKVANMSQRYMTTKLIGVFCMRELARRINESSKPKVVINCANPGLCHSEIDRNLTGFAALGIKLMKAILARSTEAGSRPVVYGGLAGVESHGQYMSDCEVRDPGPMVLGPEGPDIQTKLWSQLSARLEKIQPGILSSI